MNFLSNPISYYCKVPKFSDALNFAVSHLNFKQRGQKHANGIADSEDPDQTAPLGAV